MASSLGNKNSSGPPPTSSYRHSIRCCRLKIGSERKCRVSCHAEIQKNLFWRHKIRVSAAYDAKEQKRGISAYFDLNGLERVHVAKTYAYYEYFAAERRVHFIPMELHMGTRNWLRVRMVLALYFRHSKQTTNADHSTRWGYIINIANERIARTTSSCDYHRWTFTFGDLVDMVNLGWVMKGKSFDW